MISNDKIKADSKIRKIFISLKNIKSITYPKIQNMIKRQIKWTIDFNANTPFCFLSYFKLYTGFSFNGIYKPPNYKIENES